MLLTPGVDLVTSRHNVKIITWSAKAQTNLDSKNIESESESTGSASSNYNSNSNLEKEIIEILKEKKSAVLPLNQLSSACLRKFGRHMSKQAQQNPAMIIKKFRSNLELLGTEGKHQSRLISLTHKAQLKRFTQDITKILKSQQHTKMEINELPALYEACHGVSQITI